MNIINAVSGTGITQTADGSGLIKLQSNGVTTNALAWVNFAGASGTRNAYYNVSSVTLNSAGNYTITFTTAQTDANYVSIASTTGSTTTAGGVSWQFTSPSTSSVVFNTYLGNTATTFSYPIQIAIFGN